jgi:ArsR family transcriptional regulator
MPARALVSKELADFLGSIAHSMRIRMIEELRYQEKDVASISDSLEIAPATTSQHLAVLRELHILGARREGHKVFYKLLKPMLADWLIDGLKFLEEEVKSSEDLKGAFMEAKVMWKSKRSTQTIATRRSK